MKYSNVLSIAAGYPVLWRDSVIGLSAAGDTPFEMVVLETTLSHVCSRLRKQGAMMHSLLEVLTEETLTANPPDRVMLRRTLAFKQTLKHYEKTVFSLSQAIGNVLSSDQAGTLYNFLETNT